MIMTSQENISLTDMGDRKPNCYLKLITSIASDLDILLNDLCGPRSSRTEAASIDESSDLEQYLYGVDSDSCSKNSGSSDDIFLDQHQEANFNSDKTETKQNCHLDSGSDGENISSTLSSVEDNSKEIQQRSDDVQKDTDGVENNEDSKNLKFDKSNQAILSDENQNHNISSDKKCHNRSTEKQFKVIVCGEEQTNSTVNISKSESEDLFESVDKELADIHSSLLSLNSTRTLSSSSQICHCSSVAGSEELENNNIFEQRISTVGQQNNCLSSQEDLCNDHGNRNSTLEKSSLVLNKSVESVLSEKCESFEYLAKDSKNTTGKLSDSVSSNVAGLTKQIFQRSKSQARKQHIEQEPEHMQVLQAIDMLERLIKSRPIWYLPNVRRVTAVLYLENKEAGHFIVRKSSHGAMALSLRVPESNNHPVEHYLIEDVEDGLVRLDGSSLTFSYLPLLIAHYCQYVDELPCRLVLPPVVMNAKTHQEITSLALLGSEFWASSLADLDQYLSQADPCNGAPHNPMVLKELSVRINAEPDTEETSSEKELEALSPFRTLINFSETQLLNDSNSWKVTYQTKAQVNKQKFVEINPDSKQEVQVKIHPVKNTGLVKSSVETDAIMYKSTPIDLIKTPNTPYYRGNLSDRFSDYEDIWNTPSKGSKTKNTGENVQFQCINIADLETSPKRESFASPTFRSPDLCSDRTNEKQIPGHLKQELKIQTNQQKHMADSQPHFFRFDIDPSRQHVYGGERRFSSPLYMEPVDSVKDRNNKPLHVNIRRANTVGGRHTNHMILSEAPKSRRDTQTREKSSNAYSQNSINQFGRGACVDTLQQDNAHKIQRARSAPVRRQGLRGEHKMILSAESSPVVARRIISNRRLETPPPSPGHAHQQIITQLTRENSRGGLSRTTSLREKNVTEPVEVPAREAQTLPTDICKMKNSSSSETSDSDTLTQFSLQLPEFRPRSTTMISTYDNVKNVSCDQGVDMLDDDDNTSVPLIQPRKSNTFDQNLEDMQKMLDEHALTSPRLNKFPVSGKTDNSAHADKYTVAHLINVHAPELTVKPVQPLTAKNLQRLSAYDNVPGMGSRASMAFSARSAGTVFSKPWDNTLWADILNVGNTEHQPRNRLPTGLNDRLHEWKSNNAMRSPLSPFAPPSPYAPSQASPSFTFANIEEDEYSESSRHNDPDYQLVSEMTAYPLHSEATDYQNLSDNVDSGTELGTYSSQENINSLSRRHGQPLPDVAVTAASDERPQSFCQRLEPLLFISRLAKDINPLDTHPAAPRLINLRQRDKNHQPGIKIRNYIFKLSSDTSTIFGSTVENFIQCTLESAENSPHVVMRNVRQFMSGIKNYLVKMGEKDLLHVIERERTELEADEFLNIDAIIEGALHKCVVRPLKNHIYQLFVREYRKNGRLALMSQNIHEGQNKTPDELGIRLGLNPPRGTSMEVIKHFLNKMQEAYSPLKKLENLLGATSSIYNSVMPSTETESTISMGADDFLPMFIHVIVQCGMVSAEIEADYMWGLLHPSLLTGEGGYYLTTLSSAVHVLKNLQYLHSSDNQQTRLPAISDMQGFMRIVIPDEKYSSLIAKTLPVRPNMTTKDVCKMIAHKLKITNPQDYSLYKVVAGEETILSESACPQTIRSEHLARGMACTFVYRRSDAYIALPKSLNHH